MNKFQNVGGYGSYLKYQKILQILASTIKKNVLKRNLRRLKVDYNKMKLHRYLNYNCLFQSSAKYIAEKNMHLQDLNKIRARAFRKMTSFPSVQITVVIKCDFCTNSKVWMRVIFLF